MKLEIKHLAPYLPYGLKAEMLDHKSDYVGKQYDEVVGVHQWDKLSKYWSALTIGGSKPNIERIKPVLRPLSDLTKEISDNKGRKFILAKQLWSVSENDEDVFELFGTLPEYWDISLRALISDYRNVDYGDIQNMLKYHFDIFGLIDQGLAIDINTLDK